MNYMLSLKIAEAIVNSKIVQFEWFKFPPVQLDEHYPNINFVAYGFVIFFAIKIQIQQMAIKLETLKIHNFCSVNPNWANLGSKNLS